MYKGNTRRNAQYDEDFEDHVLHIRFAMSYDKI
jgi:hypothetical protein